MSGAQALLKAFLAPEREFHTEGELFDAMVAMDRLRTMTEAAMASVVDEFDGRGLCGADAMRSTQAWMRSRTEMSGTHASSVVNLARELRDSGPVRLAYANAVLGTAKVKMILAARVGVEPLFAEQVYDLIDAIAPLTVRDAQAALDRWHEVAKATMASPSDDDGPEPDPEDDNWLFLSATLGGRVKVDGDLDPVTGQSIIAAIDAEIAEWFRTGASTADDGEAPKHRRARALAALVARGALPRMEQGRARPSVTLNIDLAAYLGLAADDPDDLLGRRCELSTGTPISRRTADRLMCEADITAVLTRTGLDGIVEPLGAAHTKRYPTPAERRALALRDQGCVFPGCDARVEWTDAHHLDHWHLHERTELGRLVLLCRYHHHCVHEGGYQLRRDGEGHIDVIRPDRTRIPRAGLAGQLIREPTDRLAGETGAGPPGEPLVAPVRPRTRFRTRAQRFRRAGDLLVFRAKENGINLVVTDLERPSRRAG